MILKWQERTRVKPWNLSHIRNAQELNPEWQFETLTTQPC